MLFGRRKKHPITIPQKPVARLVYSTCGYCSTGCSIEFGLDEAGEPISRAAAGGDRCRGALK